MTQEEKELLLKDLCARLPHNVYIGDEYGNKWKLVGIELAANTVIFKQQSNENLGITPIEEIRPYLRPMLSMTEDEKDDFERQFGFELHIDEIWGHSLMWNTGSSDEYIDVEFQLVDMDLISTWLDRNMFDWRRIRRENKRVSMIKVGLAIEAPEGMYNIKAE